MKQLTKNIKNFFRSFSASTKVYKLSTANFDTPENRTLFSYEVRDEEKIFIPNKNETITAYSAAASTFEVQYC